MPGGVYVGFAVGVVCAACGCGCGSGLGCLITFPAGTFLVVGKAEIEPTPLDPTTVCGAEDGGGGGAGTCVGLLWGCTGRMTGAGAGAGSSTLGTGRSIAVSGALYGGVSTSGTSIFCAVFETDGVSGRSTFFIGWRGTGSCAAGVVGCSCTLFSMMGAATFSTAGAARDGVTVVGARLFFSPSDGISLIKSNSTPPFFVGEEPLPEFFWRWDELTRKPEIEDCWKNSTHGFQKKF